MRFLILLLCVIMPPSCALASSKHAPLPPALISAKKLYIDNQTGTQQTTDLAYEYFTKWGRFTVVQSRAEADVIAVFTKSSDLREGTTVESVDMIITARDGTDALFEDREVAKGFHLPNTRLGLSARKCLEEFKKRLE